MPSRNIAASTPASVVVNSVVTDARFCQPSTLVPNCRADDAIDESEMLLSVSRLDEEASEPYHRITLGQTSAGTRFTRDYNDASDADAESQQWDDDADAARAGSCRSPTF